MRNSCAGLFEGSSCMSMQNFVQIWWTGTKCRAKMWFVGQIWSILDLWPLAAILNFAINEKFLHRLVFMVKEYVHAKICQNQTNRNCLLCQNVVLGVNFGHLTSNLTSVTLVRRSRSKILFFSDRAWSYCRGLASHCYTKICLVKS